MKHKIKVHFYSNEVIQFFNGIRCWSYSKMFWYLCWLVLSIKSIIHCAFNFDPNVTGFAAVPQLVYFINTIIVGCYVIIGMLFILGSIIRFINDSINE